MLYKLLLLQFLAHLLADFIFQPHHWAVEKGKKAFTKYHLVHAVIVFGFSWLLALDVGFWKAALALTVLHLFTDMLKSYLLANTNQEKKNYFFTDQFIHILLMILVVLGYEQLYGIHFLIDIPFRTIAIVTAFVFCLKPANILIKYIFISYSVAAPKNAIESHLAPTDEESHGLPNAGKLIGIVERLIVLILILGGQYSAVGLIIAAKSILRFKNNLMNEYILIGTLLSFGIAIILGTLIKLI